MDVQTNARIRWKNEYRHARQGLRADARARKVAGKRPRRSFAGRHADFSCSCSLAWSRAEQRILDGDYHAWVAAGRPRY